MKDLLYFLPSVALVLFTLYMIGVFIRWCRDNERHMEAAGECRALPFKFEYAYAVEREAHEEQDRQ